jgi:phage terminase large subunit
MSQAQKFRFNPTYKQFLALEKLYDNSTAYVLFGGGAGGGKSWLGCEWIAANCLNFPGVRYFIGREELRRLKDTTVKTFFKVARHHKFQDTFRYYEHYSSIRFYNGSEIALIDLKFVPSDPFYEGLGSTEYTGGFIEEAGEVHFNAFDTLKSRIGRQLNDQYNLPKKILITCNPKKNWLYHTFYKPHKDNQLESRYAFIQALVNENKYIDSGYIEGLDDIKDKVKKDRLKYGEWDYENDSKALINYENILNIFTNSFVGPTNKRCITADIARFGKDNTIIRVWDGGRVLRRLQRHGLKTTESATLIRDQEKEFRVPRSNTIVDEDGVGGGVVDLLSGCKGFIANSSPLYGGNYDNLKSQCGYKLSEMINNNELYEPLEDLTAKERLIEELEQVKKKEEDSDKKKALMPKDKIKDMIGRSPDDLDTYIMKAYFDLIQSKTGVTKARVYG